jgi:hypothetical protein
MISLIPFNNPCKGLALRLYIRDIHRILLVVHVKNVLTSG